MLYTLIVAARFWVTELGGAVVAEACDVVVAGPGTVAGTVAGAGTVVGAGTVAGAGAGVAWCCLKRAFLSWACWKTEAIKKKKK
jgi:hypothetical protein